MAVTGALAIAALTISAAQATQPASTSKKTPKPTQMVPLLAVSRITSPDRAFIDRASASAIATMNSAQAEIASTHLSNAQDAAVRAFNSAAAAYNSLADIAAQRRIKLATPASIFQDDRTSVLSEDAKLEPADIQYLTAREAALSRTIAIYADEVKYGRDPIVVSYATQMKARLEHDLVVTTIGLQSLESGDYGDHTSSSTSSSDDDDLSVSDRS